LELVLAGLVCSALGTVIGIWGLIGDLYPLASITLRGLAVCWSAAC